MGTFASLVLMLIVSGFTRGYALCKLWGWFVEPTFHAPHLCIPVALGIATIVGLLTYHPPTQKDTRSFRETLEQAWSIAVFFPGFTLLFGWIYLQFV